MWCVEECVCVWDEYVYMCVGGGWLSVEGCK